MGRYTGPREQAKQNAKHYYGIRERQFRAESSVRAKAVEAGELAELIPPWLLSDTEALIGRVVRLPQRSEIQAPIEEQMIVEFYSRV